MTSHPTLWALSTATTCSMLDGASSPLPSPAPSAIDQVDSGGLLCVRLCADRNRCRLREVEASVVSMLPRNRPGLWPSQSRPTGYPRRRSPRWPWWNVMRPLVACLPFAGAAQSLLPGHPGHVSKTGALEPHAHRPAPSSHGSPIRKDDPGFAPASSQFDGSTSPAACCLLSAPSRQVVRALRGRRTHTPHPPRQGADGGRNPAWHAGSPFITEARGLGWGGCG